MGRVYRPPQAKPVVVYHLVVMDSPEIFLARLSSDKTFMQEAFVSCSDVISKSDLYIYCEYGC